MKLQKSTPAASKLPGWAAPATDDMGQGIAEYVIILAVIVVAGIVLVTAFGGQLTSVWNTVTTQFGTLA